MRYPAPERLQVFRWRTRQLQGEQLDSTKKELATEEMVVTGNLADEVGKNDATTVMNNSKIQVIKDNVQNVDDIYNIVVNVAQQNNVNLDSDQINKIVRASETDCAAGVQL